MHDAAADVMNQRERKRETERVRERREKGKVGCIDSRNNYLRPRRTRECIMRGLDLWSVIDEIDISRGKWQFVGIVLRDCAGFPCVSIVCWDHSAELAAFSVKSSEILDLSYAVFNE